MSDTTPVSSLSTPALQLIVNVCKEYENAWQVQPRPSIKPFLLRVPNDLRYALLKELTLVEHQLEQSNRNDLNASPRSPNADDPSTVVFGLKTSSLQTDLPPRIGRFIPKYSLGSGASADVYACIDSQTSEWVAVKWAHQFLSDEVDQNRFIREASNASQLGHPNIIRFIDAGREGSRPFIVFEYLNGLDLREWLKMNLPLTLTQRLQLIASACRALQFCHDHQVIHRDIKPSNLMLVVPERADVKSLTPDTPIHLKVLDFGVAKQLDNNTLTRTGALVGTPMYMSPEQAAGLSRRIDHRCDIYSIGVVLFELLTGSRPFTGNVEHVIDCIRTQEVPALRSTHPHLPTDVAIVCQRSLRMFPGDRYQRMSDLADDLERIVQGRPIRAKKVGSIESATSFARRNELIRPMLTGSIAAVVVLASFAAFQWTRPPAPVGLITPTASIPRAMHSWIERLPTSLKDHDQLATALATSNPAEWLEFVDATKPYSDETLQILAKIGEVGNAANSISDESVVSKELISLLRSHLDPAHPTIQSSLQGLVGWLIERYSADDELVWIQLLAPIAAPMTAELEQRYAQTSVTGKRKVLSSLLAGLHRGNLQNLMRFLDVALAPEIPIWTKALRSCRDWKPDSLVPEWSLFESDKKFVAEIDCIAAANRVLADLVQGNQENMLNALRLRPDPRLRTYTLHRSVELGIPLDSLLSNLFVTASDEELFGLCMLTAIIDPDTIDSDLYQKIKRWTTQTYAEHPDGGIHGLCGMLLEQWGMSDSKLAVDNLVLSQKWDSDRSWFFHEIGIPFVKLGRQDSFPMGKRTTKMDIYPLISPHTESIVHDFAISVNPLTIKDLQQSEAFAHLSPDDVRSGSLSWIQCIEYCNWLNRKFGFELLMDSNQFDEHGNVLGLSQHRGFRLPTCAEWEYACRGKVWTQRSYGNIETSYAERYIHESLSPATLFCNRFGVNQPNKVAEWTMTASTILENKDMILRSSAVDAPARFRTLENTSISTPDGKRPKSGFRLVFVP
jgi:serine/threonine protein kinase